MTRASNWAIPLLDPNRYPVSLWTTQRIRYAAYWRHFDGDWLAEQINSDSKRLKYPLKLNPFNMACLLHAGLLFGEVQDSSDLMVNTVVEPWGQDSPTNKRETAQAMTDLVNRVWYENEGRSIQQEGGLVSQILGGAVYSVAYDPSREDEGYLPIRIDHTLPEYYFPVWSPMRYHDLLEAIISFELTAMQAKETYNVDITSGTALYHGRWTKDAYDITVDGQAALWHDQALTASHGLGRVPYVYIPHIRAGEYYGISLLKGKDEIAREVNSVFADLGDIVGENARSIPAIVNTSRVTLRRIAGGQVYLDLGREVPGAGSPDIKFPSSVQVNEPTVNWANQLLELARVEAYTPPVLYGLDEGSQRSALSLALKALPLLVHVRQERTNWTTGLNQIAWLILRMAADRKLDKRITRAALKNVKYWQDWSPVMPRDHEQEVNEVIMRVNANLMSPQAGLAKLGDTQDIKTELNLIKAWMKQVAKIESQGSQDPFAGAGANGTLAGLEKPEKVQANLKKDKE